MRTLTKWCFAILFCCFGLVTSLYAQVDISVTCTGDLGAATVLKMSNMSDYNEVIGCPSTISATSEWPVGVIYASALEPNTIILVSVSIAGGAAETFTIKKIANSANYGELMSNGVMLQAAGQAPMSITISAGPPPDPLPGTFQLTCLDGITKNPPPAGAGFSLFGAETTALDADFCGKTYTAPLGGGAYKLVPHYAQGENYRIIYPGGSTVSEGKNLEFRIDNDKTEEVTARFLAAKDLTIKGGNVHVKRVTSPVFAPGFTNCFTATDSLYKIDAGKTATLEYTGSLVGKTIQWKKDGLNIAGANTATYVVTMDTDYTITAEVKNSQALKFTWETDPSVGTFEYAFYDAAGVKVTTDAIIKGEPIGIPINAVKVSVYLKDATAPTAIHFEEATGLDFLSKYDATTQILAFEADLSTRTKDTTSHSVTSIESLMKFSYISDINASISIEAISYYAADTTTTTTKRTYNAFAPENQSITLNAPNHGFIINGWAGSNPPASPVISEDKKTYTFTLAAADYVIELNSEKINKISGNIILDSDRTPALAAYVVLMDGLSVVDSTYAYGPWGGDCSYTFENVPAGNYHIKVFTPLYSNVENLKAVTMSTEDIRLDINMETEGAKSNLVNFLFLRVKEADMEIGMESPQDFTYQFSFGEKGSVNGPTGVRGGDTYDAYLFFLGEAGLETGDLIIKVTVKEEIFSFTVTPEQYLNLSAGGYPVIPTYVVDLPVPEKQTIAFTLNGHIGYRDPENYETCVYPMGSVDQVFAIEGSKVQVYEEVKDDAQCLRWEENNWSGRFCAEYPKMIFGEALTNAEGAFTLDVLDSAFIRYPRTYYFYAVDPSGKYIHTSDFEGMNSNYAEVYKEEDLEKLEACDIGVNMALPEFPIKDLYHWQDSRKKAVALFWQLDERSKDLKVKSFKIERYVLEREVDMMLEYTYENITNCTESDGVYTFTDQGDEEASIPALEYEKTYSYAVTISYIDGTRNDLTVDTKYDEEDWTTLEYPTSDLYLKIDYTALPTAKDENTLIVVENEEKGGVKETIFYLAPGFFEDPTAQKFLSLNATTEYSIYVYAAGASAKKMNFTTPAEWESENILFTLEADENSNLLEVAVYNDLYEDVNMSASVEGVPAFINGGLALDQNYKPFEDMFPSKHIYVVKKDIEYALIASVPFYTSAKDTISFTETYNRHEFIVNFDTARMVPTWLKLNNTPGSDAQRVSSFAYESIRGEKMAVQHVPSGRIFEADSVLAESGIVGFKGLPYDLEGPAKFLLMFPSKNVGFEDASNGVFIIPPKSVIDNQFAEGFPVNGGQAMRLKFTGFTLKATIDHGIGSTLLTDNVRITVMDTVAKKHLLTPAAIVYTPSVNLDGVNYAVKNSEGVMAVKVTFNAQALGSKDTIVLIDNTNDNFSCNGNVLDLGVVKMVTEDFTMQVSPFGVYEQTTTKADVGIKDVSLKMYKQGDFTTALVTAISDENGGFIAFDITGNPISKYTAVFSHAGYISDTISDLFYDGALGAIEIQKAYLEKAPVVVKYTLTIMAGTGGTAEIVGKTGTTLEMLKGEKVSVKATAAEKFKFVNWTSGSTAVSTEATYEFTMDTVNTTLTANFLEVSIDADVFAAISIYSQNGTVYISGISSSTRVEIIDALGRRLENTIANGDFSAALPKSGIYMIRLSDAKGVATRKVMVK